ncbi:hypothetical protein HY636_00545 [Candidatus Woesearchaeota archaeon]|nr:hypothetical protein [Candidatus Woesearchaeota archaeon]
MAKKSKVSSKKLNHKNVLYVIGAVIVIVLLFTLVLKYTGKQLAGKAVEYAGAAEGTLPATITFPLGQKEETFKYNGNEYLLTIGDVVNGVLSNVGITKKVETQPVNGGKTDLPDLTITHVQAILNADGTYTLIFSITNKGGISQPTYLYLEYWFDGQTYLMAEPYVKLLSSGETVNINQAVELIIDAFDGFTWVAEVDKSTDTTVVPLTESNENNNKFTGCLATKQCYNLQEQKQGICNTAGTLCEIIAVPTAKCNNGILNSGEECDGNKFDTAKTQNQICIDAGYTGGTVSLCTSTCKYDLSGCIPVDCGNNILDLGETCDGNQFVDPTKPQTQICIDAGYKGGTVSSCTSTCKYDLSGCIPVDCGNNILDLGETCDGNQFVDSTKSQTQICIDAGYKGGTVSSCTSTCKYDLSGCILG